MKNQITICFIVILALLACNKDKVLMSEGQITGADPRFCACCGGWFIDIGKTTLRFENLPEDSDLDLMNESFPVKVELDWTSFDNACGMGDMITIEEIRKR